jgi:5-methylcytosine-specific restriction endonuclease McrA
MTAKPRAPKPTSTGRRTRHVKAAVRREVWPRDQGRCGFVGEDGHRCNETRGLEFAHIQPWAKGGADTTQNLGLRCQAHNAFEADRDYGTRFMASKRKRKPLEVREPLARYLLRGVVQERGESGACKANSRALEPEGI